MVSTTPATVFTRYERTSSRSGAVLAGNCAYAAAQLGVLVVLARGSTPAAVGLYALALAVTAPIQLGLGLRLRTVRAVDLGSTPFKTYLRTALSLNGMAVLLSAAVGALVSPSSQFAPVVALVALAKGVEGIIDVCYGEYQRQDRLAAIAGSQILRAVLTVTLVTIGVHMGGLVGALVAMLVGWTVQLLAVDLRRVQPSASSLMIDGAETVASGWGLIRRSWPLGLAAAVTSLSVSLPRFTVVGLLDIATLGILAVLSYPTTAITLFANSVGQANVRAIAVKVESGDRRAVWKSLLAMVCTTAVLGVIAVGIVLIAGRTGIAWLFGEAYASNFSVLLLLLLAATLAGFATNAAYLLLSTGRFNLQPVVVCISLGLSTAVIYVATLQYGLLGTAAALVLMYALQTILTLTALAFLLRRHTH